MTHWLRALLLLLAGMLQTPSWAEETLQLSLQPAQVDITSGFAGSKLSATGSMKQAGDLIVKVVGPLHDVRLARKTKLGPFWVNGETLRVRDVPSLRFLYATAPIATLLAPGEVEKYGLYTERARMRMEPQQPAQSAAEWYRAFSRLKAKAGYYREDQGAIRVFEDGRFAADISLPAGLQTGSYRVEVLSVESGRVSARAAGDFSVRLVGLEYWTWVAAHDYPWLFGSLFTLLAVLLGIALATIPLRPRWRSR